jgi:translation initiation factor 3 subunit D
MDAKFAQLQLTCNRFVSRTNPRSPNDHIILGVLGYKPRDFASQMNLNLANGWGIVRTIVDMVLKMEDGKYVLVKDPNKSVLRLYAVPAETFEEEESVADKPEEADDAADE